MSTLVVQIPPRPRLNLPGGTQSDAQAVSLTASFAYVLSGDGVNVVRQGYATRDLLPRASHVVAVVPESDVSWHRVTVPKAPSARMGAALGGMLEDALLEDPERVHLALPPDWTAGGGAWVAAAHREWMASALRVLEQTHRVERVVPAAVPDQPPHGHFHEINGQEDDGAPPSLWLTWSTPAGVSSWPLHGSLSKALLPQPLPPGTVFTATPAAAAPAERWLGGPVRVVANAERLLAASRTTWNLRQFALAPRHRGVEAVIEQGRRLMGPRWRPARLGLIGLVAVQLLGLNLWAWQQKSAVQTRRDAMTQLLRDTHPQVRSVIDAPAQMHRETENLRTLAGETGPGDLETLLKAAASAWGGQPVQTLQYEPGRLTLSASGWNPAQVEQFRASLQPSGWDVSAQDGRITIAPRTAPAATAATGERS